MRRDDSDNFDLSLPSPLPASVTDVVAALDPLLTDERRVRISQVIGARSRAVTTVLEGLIDPHNVSAVLRSADAFGVEHVHLIKGTEPFVVSPRVAQGAYRWLQVTRHDNAHDCVSALRAHGHRIFVATMDGKLRPEALAQEPRPALVFGHEHLGVSDAMRELADGTFSIAMCGFVQSLNVSVAAAISMFSAMQGRSGDLEEGAALDLRARYCMQSVPQAEAIVAEYLRRQGR
jgi:tRNA (guanosine-2'-O-)-methyltransferase